MSDTIEVQIDAGRVVDLLANRVGELTRDLAVSTVTLRAQQEQLDLNALVIQSLRTNLAAAGVETGDAEVEPDDS
jgi:hypothetical protein